MATTKSTQPNPVEIIKSKNYLVLLVVAAIFGVPVSILAYFFLWAANELQKYIYITLPNHFSSMTLRTWWPIVPLTLAGLIVGLTVKYLPGKGGEVPVEGFKAGGGPIMPSMIIGVALAAITSIGLGAVVGPEAPLIALGGGVAYWWINVLKPKIDAQAASLVASTGSFSAVSTLLGSPLTGAFLLMEASGLGGMAMDLVLMPGILAAGIGYLVFVGLDSLTGLGLFSLSVPNIPKFANPTGVEFIWAIIFGLIAPLFAYLIRYLAIYIRPSIEKRILPATAASGLVIALLAILFVKITGSSNSFILFSGQDQLGSLISHGASLTIGTLLLIILLKGIGYSISLVSFRGGPTFPALFLGAVAGILFSHISGLPLIAGAAMGMAAMTAAMLKLPLTAILITSLLLASDGIKLMPLVIVSVTISYVMTIRFSTPSPGN